MVLEGEIAMPRERGVTHLDALNVVQEGIANIARAAE
jgi:hypothetical protein